MDDLPIKPEQVMAIARDLLQELLAVLTFYAPSAKTKQDHQADDIVNECQGNISLLLERGQQEARFGNYYVAHRLVKEALKEINSDEDGCSDAYNKILVYTFWSTINCAYYLRGYPGTHLLEQCREQIRRFLQEKKQPKAQRTKSRKVQHKDNANKWNHPAIEGYLHYLLGLTYGLAVKSNNSELPDYDSIEKELEEYEQALTCFKSFKPLQQSDEIINRWIGICIQEINRRRKRVEKKQGFFFGTSWSRFQERKVEKQGGQQHV